VRFPACGQQHPQGEPGVHKFLRTCIQNNNVTVIHEASTCRALVRPIRQSPQVPPMHIEVSFLIGCVQSRFGFNALNRERVSEKKSASSAHVPPGPVHLFPQVVPLSWHFGVGCCKHVLFEKRGCGLTSRSIEGLTIISSPPSNASSHSIRNGPLGTFAEPIHRSVWYLRCFSQSCSHSSPRR
jgi:hypothetical protein